MKTNSTFSSVLSSLVCPISAALCLATLASGCAQEEKRGQAINVENDAERFGELICEPFAECDCDEYVTLGGGGACAEAVLPPLRRMLSNAENAGMRVDSECVGALRRFVDEAACSSEFSEELLELAARESDCKLLYGRAGRGEQCSGVTNFGALLGDSCNVGLVCDGELCREPPKVEGDWCGAALGCPVGLVCVDPEGTGVQHCAPPAERGAVCNVHDIAPCEDGTYCDVDRGECRSFAANAEACTERPCGENLECVLGECGELAAVGESCAMNSCEAGAYCDFDVQTCASLPSAGEPCVFSVCDDASFCGPDDECIDNPALVCSLPPSIGFCLYEDDGVCDDPSGTGLCPAGTDEFDCDDGTATNATDTNPTATTDSGGDCPYFDDGECDEPEGTGLCPEGSDPLDCSGVTTSPTSVTDSASATTPTSATDSGGGSCPYVNDGECDEPEGTGLCPEGTDAADCEFVETSSTGWGSSGWGSSTGGSTSF